MNKKFSIIISMIAAASMIAAGYFYLQTRTLARQMSETSAILYAEVAELQDTIKGQADLLEEQSAQIEALKAEQLAAASVAEENTASDSGSGNTGENAGGAENNSGNTGANAGAGSNVEVPTGGTSGGTTGGKTPEQIEKELLEQAIRDSMNTGGTGGSSDGSTGRTPYLWEMGPITGDGYEGVNWH